MTLAAPTIAPSSPTGKLPTRVNAPTSAWTLLTAFVFAVVIYMSSGPLDDPDVWWHVRLGRQILNTHRIPHHETWSYAALGHTWVPTAWLSDVLYGALVAAAGFRALIMLKLVVCAAMSLAVIWLLRRSGASAPSRAIAFALTMLMLSSFLRERPQTFSLLFVVFVAAECEVVRRGGQLRLVPFLALQWLWANVHGMWFLGPAFLIIAAVGDLCDGRRPALPRFRRHLLAAAGAVALAAATPVGPRLVTQPIAVHSAAHAISEWLPTVLWQHSLTPYLLTLFVLVISLARQSERTSWSDVLWITAVVAFSLVASRDVAPAAILLAAPLARGIDGLARLPAEARLPRIVPAAAALCGVGFALAGGLSERPIGPTQPVRLVQELGRLPAPRHLINDYNVGGLVTGLQPRASVAIDGRTDNYSPAYVARYLDALRLMGNWQQVIANLHPDCALLPTGAAITHVLVSEDGWTVVDTEDGYSLLERRPGRVTPGSSPTQ